MTNLKGGYVILDLGDIDLNTTSGLTITDENIINKIEESIKIEKPVLVKVNLINVFIAGISYPKISYLGLVSITNSTEKIICLNGSNVFYNATQSSGRTFRIYKDLSDNSYHIGLY